MGTGLVYGCLSVAPPIVEKSRAHVQDCLQLLDEAFGGHSVETLRVVSDEYAKEQLVNAESAEDLGQMVTNPAFYGEIPPLAFCQLLHDIEAEPGQRFYDLGSGNGKLVMLAWLLGLNAIGVEIVEERSHDANEKLETLKQKVQHARPRDIMPEIKLIHGSILSADFSDADIVLTYDILFSKEMKEVLGKNACQLRPGSRVVSSRGLPGPGLGPGRALYCWEKRKDAAPQEFIVQIALEALKASDA